MLITPIINTDYYSISKEQLWPITLADPNIYSSGGTISVGMKLISVNIFFSGLIFFFLGRCVSVCGGSIFCVYDLKIFFFY